jgi:hypothetical protein
LPCGRAQAFPQGDIFTCILRSCCGGKKFGPKKLEPKMGVLMKLRTITVAVCIFTAFPLCAPADSTNDITAVTTREIKLAPPPNNENENISAKVAKPFGKFYIYTDDETKNHFYPSGWMGDAEDIKVSTAAISGKPELGKNCTKIVYAARGKKEWAGIFWQHPAGNWGTKNGGFNLSGASYVTFWARGENGGEKVSEFKMGGLSGKYPDSGTASIGPVKLKKEWSEYKIGLKGKDLRYISGGFCFTALATDNPSGCTFYLADVKYE